MLINPSFGQIEMMLITHATTVPNTVAMHIQGDSQCRESEITVDQQVIAADIHQIGDQVRPKSDHRYCPRRAVPH